MAPETSSGRNPRRNKQETSWWRKGSFLFLIVVGLALGIWLVMHRVLLKVSHTQGNDKFPGYSSKFVEEQSKHIKTLLAETNALLRDVMYSNITMSPELQQHVAHISSEKIDPTKWKQLQTVLKAEEAKVATCVSEKQTVALALQHCQQSQASSVSSSSSSSTSMFGALTQSMTKTETSPPPSTKRWLSIGIPTISRAHNEDYLLTSLQVPSLYLPFLSSITLLSIVRAYSM